MELIDEHALIQLLNAFLDALPPKFKRDRRDNVWTPQLTVFALLLMTLRADQQGYDSLLAMLRIARDDLLQSQSCSSSFCRAKQKVTSEFLRPAWEAFRSLFEEMFCDVYPLVYGYRLVGIDGVWITGKRAKTLFQQLRKKKRGRPPKEFKGQPQVLVVALVDVLTRTPIAWECMLPGQGERIAAKRLMTHLNPKTILLADRGFPSREIIDKLTKNNIKFIIRMTSGKSAFSEVSHFLETGGKDRKIMMRAGKGRSAVEIQARLLRGHPDGQSTNASNEWIIITNLARNTRWKRSTIMELYHQRWGIETFFRELKNIFGADHFHSHSLEGIKTEISMAMLASALISGAEMIAMVVRSEGMPKWNDIEQRRCNRVVLKTVIMQALLKDPRSCNVSDILDTELEIAALRARKRRPGRSYPRICKSFYGKWRNGFKRKAA